MLFLAFLDKMWNFMFKALVVFTLLTVGAVAGAFITKYTIAQPLHQNFKQNFAVFSKACERGVPEACYEVGIMYRDGEGVSRNLPKAVEYLKTACGSGDYEACGALGDIYNNGGQGVTANATKALNYYQTACSHNIYGACFSLGVLYQDGSKVKQDYNKSATYYSEACSSGQADSCYNLAYLYYEGKGVNKNQAKAVQLFKKSCDLGNDIACQNYSILKSETQSVDKTLVMLPMAVEQKDLHVLR